MTRLITLLTVMGIIATSMLGALADCLEDCYDLYIPQTGCPGSDNPDAPSTDAYLACVCPTEFNGALALYLSCANANCGSAAPGVTSYFSVVCAPYDPQPSGARRRRGQLYLPGQFACPRPLTACPIPELEMLPLVARDMLEVPQANGRVVHGECVDIMNDMDSCGGCSSTGEGVQCGEIEGVKETACVTGQCEIFSCLFGYKLSVVQNLDGTAQKRCTPQYRISVF
ncbi:hypothetical protein CALCODRAFT_499985 [Calocera cornea HHB12733]|uniref:Protein CPL1-like domain-containing protein n=1 Tax=Calocera cornea HHB12733 TaxID=1353952 RepID=A0A165E8Y6_9BASI|nr:hypothetical protein CALCODRAFT_499985 [Calocera cornea HHB12733]